MVARCLFCVQTLSLTTSSLPTARVQCSALINGMLALGSVRDSVLLFGSPNSRVDLNGATAGDEKEKRKCSRADVKLHCCFVVPFTWEPNCRLIFLPSLVVMIC